MNRNISDMFDAYEGPEELTEELSFSSERIKKLTLGRLDGQKMHRSRRKAFCTALIAAAIISVFTATALAVSGGISYHKPEEGEVYVDNYAGLGFTTEWDDIALILRFDVGKEGKEVLFRANWLPEEPNEQELHYNGETAVIYYDETRNERYYELLEKAGVPEEDRKGWCSRLMRDEDPRHKDVQYQILIYNAKELYKSDCVIGLLGGDAAIVKEGELNGFSLMELTMEHGMVREKHNYVILFDQERNFMVRIGGTLDMESLEKIAENLEVLETVHTVTAEEPEEGIWNRTLIDVSRG